MAPASAPAAEAATAATTTGLGDPPGAEPTRWKLAVLLGVGAVICMALAASVGTRRRADANEVTLAEASLAGGRAAPAALTPPQNSVAVLPFLDLTNESMDQEYVLRRDWSGLIAGS